MESKGAYILTHIQGNRLPCSEPPGCYPQHSLRGEDRRYGAGNHRKQARGKGKVADLENGQGLAMSEQRNSCQNSTFTVHLPQGTYCSGKGHLLCAPLKKRPLTRSQYLHPKGKCTWDEYAADFHAASGVRCCLSTSDSCERCVNAAADQWFQ